MNRSLRDLVPITLEMLATLKGGEEVYNKNLDTFGRYVGPHGNTGLAWEYDTDRGVQPKYSPFHLMFLVERPIPVREVEGGIVECINILRYEEGDSVTILCDNPDPARAEDNNAIECVGDWTFWRTQRYSGRTLLEALQKAVRAKRESK